MRHKRWLAAVVWIWCGCRQRPDLLPGFPRLVLWAWERPERLEFLDPRSAGVAFLARTVSWHAGQITSHPRLQVSIYRVGSVHSRCLASGSNG
jgi:hypothetical protein